MYTYSFDVICLHELFVCVLHACVLLQISLFVNESYSHKGNSDKPMLSF